MQRMRTLRLGAVERRSRPEPGPFVDAAHLARVQTNRPRQTRFQRSIEPHGGKRWHSPSCPVPGTIQRRCPMLELKPLDSSVPIFQQIGTDLSPVILVNVFQVAEADIPALLKAWEADANWMKQQPGYISTQLHRGIAGSTVFMNYAVWESVAHFRAAFNHPDF
jgi:quinol monooxygenase YgiN